MNRKTDVLVIGSGIAGMSAALAATKQGKDVIMLCRGAGSLSISSGCIDVLGYCYGTPVLEPFKRMGDLAENHPYTLIGGVDAVKESLYEFASVCGRYGLKFSSCNGENSRLITVMGTLKPSYLYPISCDTEALESVHRACVATVDGMKDVHPRLIIDQLSRYEELSDLHFFEAVLPCPIVDAHRNVTPVDIARYVESSGGEQWLCESLAPYARLYPVIILPPILGMENRTQIYESVEQKLGVKLIEMISIPPNPAGIRLHGIMRRALVDAGVTIIENTEVKRAETESGVCRAIISSSVVGENRWEASAFIVATGGVLGGGIITEPGNAFESIYKIPIEMPPSNSDWSSSDIFGKSAFASMGVKTDTSLRAVLSDGTLKYSNVFFVGRTLGGYDFAAEKSGNGVALATGWYAGKLAGKE